MDEFVTCDRCEKIIKNDEYVEYRKEILNVTVKIHMCFECLEELIERDLSFC
ncbi:hypothetical protein KGF47_18090 [Clostridioides sp. ZZV13-5731]|uniref:hypothetical protein n=1 Tax=Clostridioides sp. ZZV13-5731 TaxID=2811485 RepID=UPI001D0F5812|nr:hypothetical protein [Clostridioides sp. ZZV13-5731]